MEGFLTEGAFALGPEDWADLPSMVNGDVTGRGSLRAEGHDQEEQGRLIRGWR